GPTLDRVERAEHARLLDPGLAVALCAAVAQSGTRAPARCEPPERRRGRRDVAAQEPERRVADCVHDRYARGAREARRLRGEPVSEPEDRDAVPRPVLAL